MARYLILLLFLSSCAATEPPGTNAPAATGGPKYSLGQWSFHAALFAGEMDNYDFVRTAGEMGFAGVELVNQFFLDQSGNTAFLDSLAATADAAGVELTMLLVDRAGNLGASDPAERDSAIAQHLAWVRAADHLDIPAVRVNAHGDGTPDAIMEASVDGIGRLAEAAGAYGIRILVENHGGISNDGEWLAALLGRLGEYTVGAVADFDNWCIERDNGQLWGGTCTRRYDRYQGLLELMPYAGGVSVKAFNFDERGRETSMDYDVLFDIIRGAGYEGFLGIEYEGESLPPRLGIERTLALAENSWPRQPVVDQNVVSRIDTTLRGFVNRGDVAGISALVYEKGEEVYFGAFGDADREAGTSMQRNTIVQIYSMTKPITGVALMQLYERGKFKLDDPLGDHLPEFAGAVVYRGTNNGSMQTVKPHRPVTIRDITRHTAGFYNGGDTPGLQQAYESANVRDYENTLTEMGEKLGSLPLLFQPGTRWHYGLSVDVQALLVERLSGQPFDEYVREHVLDPLGMDDTRYFVPIGDRSRMSAAYNRSDEGVLTQRPNDDAHEFNVNRWPLTPGGFGLTSTLDDYMTFARMLVSDGSLNGATILQPRTVDLMRTNHLSNEITERLWLPSKGQVGFGIDFAVRLRPAETPEENPGTVGEFFWDGAASTLFWVDPANELTAVLFVQLFPYDQIGLHHDFRRAVYGPFGK
ncbi:CubicO group peptidase (beta-lactamase class C family)/sugar phosphate isomerase/epimerase [Lewinella aquimaris]|uniref:CubicO group peptidase (Beta-lactamase class C family)/sugar phosphate isomerase/epimerase n=1 Tax=Neolewinella aquimaris TaxID=1835722 RepID=A0A840E411_9BACT|nr:serine hydrolase [Neolewinella aquimaris]MBB4078482.1 CubicO group peptidase (beta-lactamase class C family)/sugar phosphate isomerase/epimerase [Neolewinella aquimaris]